MRKAPGGSPGGPYESEAAGLLAAGWRRWQPRASRRAATLSSVVFPVWEDDATVGGVSVPSRVYFLPQFHPL